MIDDLISRIKNLYYNLESDSARKDRLERENLMFGVSPPPDFGAAPEPAPPESPSPSPGAPPAAAPPVSLLDQIGRSRGGL